MAKVLFRLPRSVVDNDSGRVVSLNGLEEFYVSDLSKGFSTRFSRLSPDDLSGSKFFVVNKDSYVVFDSDFLDDFSRLKRLAQTISLKDLGRIITLLGLNRDSVLVEAGSGSGAATLYFSRIVKKVFSYDVNPKHQAVAKSNVSSFGVDNVEFFLADVYDSSNVLAHGADAFLLDVPEPVRALPSVVKALRVGGRAVIYSPNLTQLRDVALNLPSSLLLLRTVQVTEQDWEVSDLLLRPRMQGLGHTAFLMLLRKIPEKN